MDEPAVITLTTDFGTADNFVGAMKGVILSINPRCAIVDITHHIAPQDVMEGCFSLAASYSFFPEKTIHVAVVDPGVGGPRRPLLIATETHFFIGPDNGIFSFVFSEPGEKNIFEITESRYFLPEISTTFHGRDIFAPVAAHLSKGTPPACFGNAVSECVIREFPAPNMINEKELEAEIIHIDRFGNLITNARMDMIEKLLKTGDIRTDVNGHSVSELLTNYIDARDDVLFFIMGSSGCLEISAKNKSAQKITGARRGDRILLKTGP